MNYILHIDRINDLFYQDERLSPWHISLYYALFHAWNHAKFPEAISISRDEMMHASKIGSVNTYLKCLKELDQFGYIRYEPSKNPLKGSLIYMFIFNTCDEQVMNISCTSTDTMDELRVRPYLNNINRLNNKNSKTREKANFRSHSDSPAPESKKIKKEKSTEKKEPMKKENFKKPDQQEVTAYFLEKQNSPTEAERFFNHFESNGWLVGGKTKMKDWKAAARNWMLRSNDFQHTRKPINPLSTNQNKDYSIPL